MSALHEVTTLDALPLGRPVRVHVRQTPVLLLCDGEAVRAYAADCPHAGAPLEQGAVCEGRLVGPWHKSAFAMDDGRLLEPPALQGLRRYAVQIDGRTGSASEAPLAPVPVRAPQASSAPAGPMVVIGGGTAAAALASLREAGYRGELICVAHEGVPPYDRTALSKFVLAEQAVRVEPTSVVHLDAASRRIGLADGREIAAAQVLLASGGCPRHRSAGRRLARRTRAAQPRACR